MAAKQFVIRMSILSFIAGFFLSALILLSSTKNDYNNGFQAGIKHEKRMRQQAHDSIVANCIYNNGIPTTAVAVNDSVLKENFPKHNMNKLLRGE